MRNWALPAIFISLIFLIACGGEDTKKENRLLAATPFAHKNWPFRLSDLEEVKVTAHRATPHVRGYPENSLAGIQYLMAKGDFWIETDVQYTADGRLILFHDESLERLTNGYGRVQQHTLDELQALLLKDTEGELTTFHVSELSRVLDWNAREGKTVLMLDVKRGVPYETVIDLIKNRAQGKSVIFITYSVGAAEKVHRLAPDLIISVPVRNLEEWDRLKASNISLDRVIAFTGTVRSPKVLYDTLHRRDIAAIFGTLGNIDREATARGNRIYDSILKNGADVLSTDRPLEVMNYLNNEN